MTSSINYNGMSIKFNEKKNYFVAKSGRSFFTCGKTIEECKSAIDSRLRNIELSKKIDSIKK